MEGNRVRRAESVRCGLQFVFTPGRLVIVSGWCLWTCGVRVWAFFFGYLFIPFSGPWLGTTTLLWGGVVMRLHLGRLFIFILLWPFSVFSRIVRTMGFFMPTPWGVSQG